MDDNKKAIQLFDVKVIFADLEDRGFGRNIVIDATDQATQDAISIWVKDTNINGGKAHFKDYTTKDGVETKQYTFPKTNIEKILDLIKAPDFSGGGYIIYDRDQMRKIYETGQGPIRIRSRYKYDKEENCIDILQIPYSTSIEAILDSIAM